ncbi:uncharacterized protein RB166_021810 [Leptodactylus fuscus]|uniref:uncharacterized protein LOC142191420 n=1 Tax=Leptodactylus fuscus TaxID=238119 RepID=UPI003F4EC562
MAEAAVTYADLRFAEISRWVMSSAEASAEGDNDYLDVTYENVAKPAAEKKEPEAPPGGRCRLLLTGLGHWAPHLALLFLLLCLLLSAVTIERTMKYLHVSSELQDLMADHQAMNESLMENLQSKEKVLSTLRRDLQETQRRVEQMTEDTERLASSLRQTKDQLQEQTNISSNVQKELESAEKMLREAKSQLSQWEDICPVNWILVGRKCLLITDEEGSWSQCDEFCKKKEANLVVVQWSDPVLQASLSNKMGECWVGKELRWNNYQSSWEWPNQYQWTGRGTCWQIRNGNLMSERCSERKTCVCERNLVSITIKKVYRDTEYPQFRLWDTGYYCYGRQ